MIAGTVNASEEPRLARMVRTAVRVLPVLLLLAVLGCKKKPKPFPPAPQLVSTATTEGAPMGLPSSQQMMTATPSSLPAPADTMSPPDRAAFEQTKDAVHALEAMVKRGVVTNPDKPEEDANAKCASIEEARPRVEALADPDAKRLAADSKRLCSLEVPVINADQALKQVTISPSQASRQLMCKYAQKDIDKARAFKATDRRVRDLELRFSRSCR